jgi:hypothetical protein
MAANFDCPLHWKQVKPIPQSMISNFLPPTVAFVVFLQLDRQVMKETFPSNVSITWRTISLQGSMEYGFE